LSPLAILIGFGAGSIAFLWIVQSLLLLAHHLPLAGPLRVKEPPPLVRWPMKAALQLVFIALLFGFPLAIGQDPVEYHRAKLPPARAAELAEGLAATLSCFIVGTFIECLAGWVELRRRYGFLKSLRKVLQGFLTPVPLAFMEEAVFRGVVLEQLLVALPDSRGGRTAAVVLSAAIFSAAHFLRPAKSYWPALGLGVLGCLLGGAYIAAGRSYWLPAGLHAGGILAIQLLRPFVVYHGPPWIIGSRSYPIAGAIGIGVLAGLGIYVALRFGGAAG
jgi:CAAX prenyl protease-like protein